MMGCADCRFGVVKWRKGDKFTAYSSYDHSSRESARISTQVECRRHAPRGPMIWPDNGQEYSAFPHTDGDTDWCGEFDQGSTDA